MWTSGNSTDVVSIRATISGPTEEDTRFVFIDVNYTPSKYGLICCNDFKNLRWI